MAIGLALALAPAAWAACDLQIKSAGPCLADSTEAVPHVGDAYGLKVVVRITGTPTRPFRIKWTMANVTAYSDNITAGAGENWWWYFVRPMDLDDTIPWSVTLDPDGVSGDTDLSNNTLSGVFTPIPPPTPVDLFAPRLMRGAETSLLSFGSGIIPNLWVLFGLPTTHGAQQVFSVTGPVGASTVVTAPYGVSLFEVARANVSGNTFQDTLGFAVQLSRIRVNPALLRTVTWSDLAALSPAWTQWLAPDTVAQSTDPGIADFVQQSLPANYRSVLTPYDTARTLHRAVMKKLAYQSPPSHADAVHVLQDGVADCGGFSALLTACLRKVGIPARRILGFRQGDTVWHVRVEFHLSGNEWLVADPTDGQSADPTGTYAYAFGYVPNADSYVAVDTGDVHVMPYNTFESLQTPNFWWNGGAPLISRTVQTTLVPYDIVPTLTAPPVRQQVNEGGTVTLSVVAIDTVPLGYQWKKGAVALTDSGRVSGTTTATLTITGALPADSGTYSVVVTNSVNSATSTGVDVGVVPTGTTATHAVVGGYLAGGTATITNTFTYTGSPTRLRWHVLLPDGWSYTSSSGNEGETKPSAGTISVLDWEWSTVPPSPVTFTYTLNVPAGNVGNKTLTTLATLTQNSVRLNLLALPDPLSVAPMTWHSADADKNSRISLIELTRVIELYNTRNGTIRTGCYAVQPGTEDGFAPDATRAGGTGVTLGSYHSADEDRNGKVSLLELTRVIELYNYRSGTTRTGQYHTQVGTEDGFNPGP